MKYRFEQLIPLPMIEIPTAGSEIWEADSFTFDQERSYLVEAASGKGKTSLLSIMYGLRKDYNGKLFLDDIDVSGLKSRDWSHLRKNQVSYIFQGLQLFEDMTAMDNILLKNQVTNHKNKEEIIALTEELDVGKFLNKKIRFMSFGQQQRIAIVRALCQPFNFLFADECFSHIDRNNGAKAMELIKRECKKQGAGLILTSLGNIDFEFDQRVVL